MEKNYIILHKSLMEDALYQKEPFTKWQAWIDLVFLAYGTPSELYIRGIKVHTDRGCVYMGVNKLSERWKWSRGKVERFIRYLADNKRIEVKTSNTVNCIIILGYDQYQGVPQTEKSKEKPKSRPKKPISSLITKGREVFEKRFSDLFDGNAYYWQAKDAVAMDALTKKITYSRSQRDMPCEDDDIVKALTAFLNSITDQWILKNFSVTMINNKYNEIVSQAKANIINDRDSKGHQDKRRGSEVTATGAKDYEGAF